MADDNATREELLAEIAALRKRLAELERLSSAEKETPTDGPRRSEDRWAEYIERAGDMVFTLDTAGRVTSANQAVCKATGRALEELLGKSPLEFVAPEGREATEAALKKVLNGEPVDQLEVEILSRDGRRMFVEARGRFIREGDQITGTFHIARDFTDRKQSEKELQKRNVQLEVLREVGLELTAELDLETLLRSIAARGVELIQGSRGGLYLYRPERDVTEWTIAVGSHDVPTGTILARGKGLCGRIQQTGKPMVVNDYKNWEGRAACYEGLPIDAVVGAPIRWADTFFGVLLVEADAPRTFSPADAELLHLLASHAAIAIHNAHMFEKERQQRELTEALAEAAAVVGQSLDLDEVLDRILEQVERVVAGSVFNIMLVEGENARVVRQRGYEALEAGEQVLSLCVPVTRYSYLTQMMRSGQSVVASDTLADPNWVQEENRDWLRSYVAAPIRLAGRTIGFLNVNSSEPGRFGVADARRLEAFAHHAAIAIENARLYRETAHRLAQSQVLREVMLAAASTLDFDQMLERTLQAVQAALGVEFISFAVPNQERTALTMHSTRIGYASQSDRLHLPLDESICGRVYQTGQAVCIGDVRQVPYHYPDNPVARSELAVPVCIGRKVVAILDVESRRLDAFDEEDLAFYSAIAGQLGIMLENAQLYEQVRQQADELAGAVARLRELDRLKNEFIQNVSHELRSPLALIWGYAELLASGTLGALTPEQQEPVEVILRRTQMVSDLVKDITFIMEAEANTPEPEPVPLDELVRLVTKEMRIAVDEAGLTLQTRIAPNLPPVSGLQSYLRRVLDNLIGNAIKFTPRGGTISVAVEQEEDFVLLAVSDTGIGIAPDQQPRIFDRFYQIDGSATRRYSGVGLGLALVKEIVETYGGEVRVESEPGAGSTFTVALPVHRG